MVFKVPYRFMLNIWWICSVDSVDLSPLPAEIPAFAMARSMGVFASVLVMKSAMAVWFVTSMVFIMVVAPFFWQDLDISSRRFLLRAVRIRVMFGAAYSMARAAPMPLDAPVIRMFFGL